MADSIKLKLEVDAKNSVNTLESLEDKLTELRQKIKNVEIGSQEFKKLSSSIKNTESQVKNLNKSMEGMDIDQVTGEFGRLTGGITAAFTGIIALSGEANESMENMVKTVAKGMAIAQGFRGAAEAVTAATRVWSIAQKVLNKVMNSNPIGLIITAVAALTTGIFFLVKWLKNLETQEEKNIKAEKEMVELMEKNNSVFEKREKLIKNLSNEYEFLTGKITKEQLEQRNIISSTEAEIQKLKEDYLKEDKRIREDYNKWLENNEGASYSIKKSMLDQTNKDLIKNTDLFNKNKFLLVDIANKKIRSITENSEKELAKLKEQQNIDRLNKIKDQQLRELEEIEKRYSFEKDLYKTQIEIDNSSFAEKYNHLINIHSLEEKSYNDRLLLLEEQGKKETDVYKLLEIEKLNSEQEFQSNIKKLQEDELKWTNDIILRKRELEVSGKENTNQELYELELEHINSELELIKSLYGEESIIYQEHLLKKQEFENEYKELKKQQEEEERLEELNNITNHNKNILSYTKTFHNEQLNQLRKLHKDKKITDEEYTKTKLQLDENLNQSQQTRLQLTSSALSQTSSMFEENTAAYKVLASAQATINAYMAASNAIAQYPTPFNAIMAAIAVAQGLLQVAKINQVQFADGGLLTGPSHSNGGISTHYGELEGGEAIINKNSMSNPSLRNIASAVNTATGGKDFSIGDGSIKLNEESLNFLATKINDKKVYVSETDITETQNRVKVMEDEAIL